VHSIRQHFDDELLTTLQAALLLLTGPRPLVAHHPTITPLPPLALPNSTDVSRCVGDEADV